MFNKTTTVKLTHISHSVSSTKTEHLPPIYHSWHLGPEAHSDRHKINIHSCSDVNVLFCAHRSIDYFDDVRCLLNHVTCARICIVIYQRRAKIQGLMHPCDCSTILFFFFFFFFINSKICVYLKGYKRSNTPWHHVKLSFPTTSLRSFRNLREDRTILHCSLCLQPRNRHEKATNNAQNSTKLQQQYNRVPACSSRHQISASLVRFLLRRQHSSPLSCSS